MSVAGSIAGRLKCGMAAELLRSFGELRLQVTGSSMLPALWPGDILTIRQINLPEATPGQIVLYLRAGRLFAHRVLECGQRGGAAVLITRGDALETPDLPVDADELLGRVVRVARGGREFVPRPPAAWEDLLSRFLRAWGFALPWLLRFYGWWRRFRWSPADRIQGDGPHLQEQA